MTRENDDDDNDDNDCDVPFIIAGPKKYLWTTFRFVICIRQPDYSGERTC